MVYPHLPQIINANLVYKSNFNFRYNRLLEKRIQETSKKQGAVLKSFFKSIEQLILAGEDLYLENDTHFNKKGIQTLGNKIANWITQNPESTIGFRPIYQVIKKLCLANNQLSS